MSYQHFQQVFQQARKQGTAGKMRFFVEVWKNRNLYLVTFWKREEVNITQKR